MKAKGKKKVMRYMTLTVKDTTISLQTLALLEKKFLAKGIKINFRIKPVKVDK